MSRSAYKDPFRTARPLYATCDTGMSDLVAAELTALGAQQVFPGHRGVGFFGDRQTMVRANLESRIANRILLPVAEFPATDRESLYDGVRRVDWSRWFDTGKTIALDASSNRSELSHTAFMGQVAKDAICDHFRDQTGERPSVDKRAPDVSINVRVDRDHCIVSLDTSGLRLFRRGYRRESGEAPIKETLAAAILTRCGWAADMVLVDPMCGSGTFLIEAALIATNTAPGWRRATAEGFGFMRLHGHDQEKFTQYLTELDAQRTPLRPGSIIGTDIDGAILEVCRRNLDRSRYSHLIGIERCALHNFKMPANAADGVRLLISNPPYGERLGRDEDLVRTYQQLGDVLRREFRGGEAGLIMANDAPKALGLRPELTIPMRNGSIDCHLLRLKLHATPRPPRSDRR